MFCTRSCIGIIGRKGTKALATNTENTLPKLELAVILMYLSMLAKVRRPSITPSSKTIRLFSNNMMSAASFAMSTAVSTEMPMSAARRAGASLMPSPMKPTTCPLALRKHTMRSLCEGVSLANTLWLSTFSANSLSLMRSISLPSSTPCGAKPTSPQILAVTSSLSPVRILTVIPCSANALSAGAVDSFGGSRKAT